MILAAAPASPVEQWGRLILALAVSAGAHLFLLLTGSGMPAAGSGAGEPVRPTPATLSASLLEKTLTQQPAPVDGLPVKADNSARSSEKPPVPPARPENVVAARESPIPLGDGPRYYLPQELDVRPQIMTRTEPEFPQAAVTQGLSARFTARIFIDDTGRVERVWVPDEDSANLFAPAVVKAFLAARYTPGIKNGRPVRSVTILEFHFEAGNPEDRFPAARY